jgi:hypothetical protein
MNQSVSEYFETRQGEIPELVDLRDLEVPGPMQYILMTSTQIKPGERFLVHLPHIPHPLFPHLQTRGMQWHVFEQTDGSAKLLVWRAS